MALDQVYSNEYGEIQCDRIHHLVRIHWFVHCSGQPLRDLFSEALRHATSSQLKLWLCDMRKLYYIEMADQNWLINMFFPFFNRKYHHRVAFVVNISNYELRSGIQTQNMVIHTPGLAAIIDMDFFLTNGEAEHWLLS